MADPFLFISTFIAGVLTFLAPCTLPLLPAYLGYISGLTHKELTDPLPGNGVRVRVFKHAFAFVFGFTLVFVTFGLLAGFAGGMLAPVRSVLTVAGGAIVFIFGLFLLGVFKLQYLTRERRLTLPERFRRGTPATSFLLGSAFAFGWTPCIGPILGTVLYFASATETLTTGAALLFVFSVGFALPFMLLALVIERAGEYVTRAAPYLRAVSIVGGVVLLILGTHLMFGDTVVSEWFFRLFEYVNIEDALIPYL
jgi:cytochrome c-type biogenesis protein